jgi:hypothetical protein
LFTCSTYILPLFSLHVIVKSNVITSAGTYTGGSKDYNTSVYLLAQVVQDLGLETTDNLEVNFATSTLSLLVDLFLINLLSAAQGNPLF